MSPDADWVALLDGLEERLASGRAGEPFTPPVVGDLPEALVDRATALRDAFLAEAGAVTAERADVERHLRAIRGTAPRPARVAPAAYLDVTG